MDSKFREVNYYLTQFLSGNGYFCKYLYKMGKMTRPNCIYGDASIDDAEHTLFHCERWILERRNLEVEVGACTIENFCDVILSSEENWNSMASYAEVSAFLRNSDADVDMKEPYGQRDLTSK